MCSCIFTMHILDPSSNKFIIKCYCSVKGLEPQWANPQADLDMPRIYVQGLKIF